MKKYFSMLVVAALGLFTSCSEDALVGGEEGGELTTISVTAPQLGLGTRAGATAFADPALSDMRVALIISTEDNRVITVTTKTHSFGTGSTPCTFEARLYKGKTYNLSVWADYGDTYYTIPTQPSTTAEAEATLPVVKMASTTITGNVNNYDAYFGNETKTLTGNETINIVLSRPFALVKVNTTDWDENAVKLAGYRPDAYATTFNAPTQLNLVSGIADAAADINTSADIVEYDQDGNPKQLHYDYLFANTTASILNPFTVVYSQGGTASSDYTFENIPVQRNYQTNITGNILTKNGKINVTITPNWNQPATEIELKEVSTPSVANADLKDHKTDTNAKGYIVKTTPNDDNTIIIPENTKAASLAYTLENLGSENKITVKDETPGTATTTYPNDVTLKVPAGANPTVYVNTQSAHVTVIGDANVVYANTSENTFVVAEGSTVSKIVVEKGNVAVFGTVTSIERSTNPANPDATTIVNLYDGAVWTNWATEKTTANIKPIVNLGTYIFDPTGYNVEGSTVVANEGTPATWSVVVNEEWSTHAAASFSNISGTTITIMTAPELALLAKESEKYKAYTVKLGAYIDLGAYYWNPITSFEGTFDGQNYVISNMKLHGDTDKGFFNKLEGSVKDLVIANATVDVKGDDCGILAGKVGTVSITNVKIQKSTLTTTGERVGAIAGNCYAHIDGCEVTECSLTGTEQVGAVLGYMALGYVKNCKATQNAIHATLLRAGGLIGKAEAAYGNLGPNPSSPVCINNNTISGTVTATDANTVGGIAGQIMGDDPRYEILNNSIDVPGTNCPIGTLRASQSTKFTSVLAEKITGNTWTKATLDAKTYVYTAAETGAGDQVIYNGERQKVAQIGSKTYYEFQAALDDVPEGVETTIKLLSDVVGTASFVIPGNKNVCLELNGKTISTSTKVTTNYAVFINKGILTIQDNTDTQKDGTGTGKITSVAYNPDMQPVPGYATNTITNYGTLNVKSGILESASNGSASFTIDNAAEGAQWYSSNTDVIANITGGKILAGQSYAIRMYLEGEGKIDNHISISNATIANMWVQENDNCKPAKGTLSITDSKFLGNLLVGYSGYSEHFALSISNSQFAGKVHYQLPTTDVEGNIISIDNITAAPFFMDYPKAVLHNGTVTIKGELSYGWIYAEDEEAKKALEDYGWRLEEAGYTTWFKGYLKEEGQLNQLSFCIEEGYEAVCVDEAAGKYEIRQASAVKQAMRAANNKKNLFQAHRSVKRPLSQVK